MDYIPHPYPQTVDECLKITEGVNYQAAGFPVFFLTYDYTFKKWSCTFRNPINFQQPKTDDVDPLVSFHLMFNFLNKQYKELKK